MVDIDLWQVPLLVGAGTVALAYLVSGVAKAIPGGRARSKAVLRTAGLASLSVVLFGLMVLAFQAVGTSTLADLAAIASLVLEAAALRWTYLAYRATRAVGRSAGQVEGGDRPAQVASAAPPPTGQDVPRQQGHSDHADWPGDHTPG